MEGYEKTENLKLNKFDDNNIFDSEPLTDNFEKLDEAISNIDLKDTKITCTAKDNKKLDVVLKDINTKIDSIDPSVTDTKVTCTAKDNKKLDVVLKDTDSKLSNHDVAINKIVTEVVGEADRLKNKTDNLQEWQKKFEKLLG